MDYIIINGELRHWGIKGMKWGVRRYQNKDGSLTEAGEKRYAKAAEDKDFYEKNEDGVYTRTSKKGKTELLKFNATKYAKEDNESVKTIINETKNVTSSLKNLNDMSIRQSKKNRPRMDLSNMSDKEMRDKINRELLERQYNDVFNTQNSTRGREVASDILEAAGSVLVVAGSAVGLAVGIYELREKMGL